MLNRHSLPVWILADALGAMLMITLLVGTAVVPLGSQAILGKREDSVQLASWDSVTDSVMETVPPVLESLDQSQLHSATAVPETYVPQQLLGIRGSLERTVFVLDTSGSMGWPRYGRDQHGEISTTGWEDVVGLVTLWLQALPIENLRIICFSGSVEEFPEDPGWLRSTDEIQEAINYVQSRVPRGRTNTEAALEQAAAWQPTCIILFTDGLPTDVDTGHHDPIQVKRILHSCSLGRYRAPINVVALNGSLREEAAEDERLLLDFARQVALLSGGVFFAR